MGQSEPTPPNNTAYCVRQGGCVRQRACRLHAKCGTGICRSGSSRMRQIFERMRIEICPEILRFVLCCAFGLQTCCIELRHRAKYRGVSLAMLQHLRLTRFNAGKRRGQQAGGYSKQTADIDFRRLSIMLRDKQLPGRGQDIEVGERVCRRLGASK